MEVSGRTGAVDKKQEKGGNMSECEACNGEGVRTKADGLCVECEEFICKKCFKDHLKSLTRLETEGMIQSSKIAEVNGQLVPDLYSESGLFIQTVTLKSIIRDLQQSVAMLQKENTITQFNFGPDKQLQDLTKSLHNLGKIYCFPPPSIVSKEEPTKLSEKTHNKQLAEDCCSDTGIVVGSHVRHKFHRLGKGIVTHVGTNDVVKVQWDWYKLPREYNIECIELV